MNRQLHNSDEVFISAQQGWEHMQLLLDKKLPVKNEKRTGKFYFKMMAAASLVTMFLMSTLVLNNPAFINLVNKKATIEGINKSRAVTSNLQPDGSRVYSMNAPGEETAIRSIIKKGRTSVPVILSESDGLSFRKIAFPEITEQIVYPPIKTIPKENVITKTAMAALPKDNINSDSAGPSETTPRHLQKRMWNFSAGLAMNVMTGQRQNFTPYPAAVLRYNFSKRLFVSVGLTAGSHVSGEYRGVKKTTYVNDMVNNVQFYNTVNQYYDFSYADIPLLTGVNISKNISLQAGVQASVLLHTKTKAIIEQYDFQMRLAGSGTNGFVNGTAVSPVSETDYRVEARKMDYRITSGIKYSINKFAFNIMYQHALQPVLTGNFTSGNKHKLVTLNMQFNIK